MADLMIIVVVALIVGAAACYIYKAKKRGVKCIGCAAAANGTCGGNCGCGCSGDGQ